MHVKKINDEVLYAVDQIVKVGRKDIQLLKGRAQGNKRKRIRLCAHKNVKDNLHEMFIVHTKGTYVRPHKHLNKTESLYVIEGSVNIIVFDDEGNIIKALRMGNYSSGNEFYLRIPGSYYHTMLIKSEFLVFHEITTGPFKKSDTIFPPWSPNETDSNAIKEFMDWLSHSAVSFLSNSKEEGYDRVTKVQ